MAWKMLKRSDCQNQIGVEKIKLKNLSGTFHFEFTGKLWKNDEDGTAFPTFRIIRVEDQQVVGESPVTCPPRLPEEIKSSAVKFAEQYKIYIEDGVIAIIQK